MQHLKLAIWGVLEYGREREIRTERTVEILEEIRPLLSAGGHISVIPYWWVKSEEELRFLAGEIFPQGWEGLVIRNPGAVYTGGTSSSWIKVKSRADRAVRKGDTT